MGNAWELNVPALRAPRPVTKSRRVIANFVPPKDAASVTKNRPPHVHRPDFRERKIGGNVWLVLEHGFTGRGKPHFLKGTAFRPYI